MCTLMADQPNVQIAQRIQRPENLGYHAKLSLFCHTTIISVTYLEIMVAL